MKQLLYVCKDLAELKYSQLSLEAQGVADSNIHIISNDEQGLCEFGLPVMSDFSRLDIVNSGVKGALLGVVGAVSVIFLALILGWAGIAGWVPFFFLALIVLGFCTWEGGLLGIGRINQNFAHLQQAISRGEHVLVVDVSEFQENRVLAVLRKYPGLTFVPNLA